MIVTQLYGQDVNELWNPKDPVGILNAILQREGKGEPEFRLIRKAGSNTILAVYHVGIYTDKNFIAEGNILILSDKLITSSHLILAVQVQENQ